MKCYLKHKDTPAIAAWSLQKREYSERWPEIVVPKWSSDGLGVFQNNRYILYYGLFYLKNLAQ